MASDAVCSKAAVLLLLIYFLCTSHCFGGGGGVLCWSLFWYALLYVFSSFAIILTRKRELVTLLLLSCYCMCPVALPHGAVGWSAVSDCGLS